MSEDDPDKTRALPRGRSVQLPELDELRGPDELDDEKTPNRKRQATQPIRRRKRAKATTSKLPRRLPDDDDTEASDGVALSDFEEDAARPRRKLRRVPVEEPELDFQEETPSRERPQRKPHARPRTVDATGTVPDFPEEREGIRAVLLNPLVAWSAAAALLLVAVVLAVTRGGGVDADALARFHTAVEAENLTRAEAELQALAPPETLEPHLREQIDELQKQAARKLRRDANRAFKAKDWPEALKAAKAAAEIDADGDLLFLIAESLRLSADPAAGEAYDQFLSAFPKHEDRDDALFWRAESLLAAGDKEKALQHFREILTLSKSNFRRSAARRVEELQ